jgi:hypothetical protein
MMQTVNNRKGNSIVHMRLDRRHDGVVGIGDTSIPPNFGLCLSSVAKLTPYLRHTSAVETPPS